jgi:hypothetical protein
VVGQPQQLPAGGMAAGQAVQPPATGAAGPWGAAVQLAAAGARGGLL